MHQNHRPKILWRCQPPTSAKTKLTHAWQYSWICKFVACSIFVRSIEGTFSDGWKIEYLFTWWVITTMIMTTMTMTMTMMMMMMVMMMMMIHDDSWWWWWWWWCCCCWWWCSKKRSHRLLKFHDSMTALPAFWGDENFHNPHGSPRAWSACVQPNQSSWPWVSSGSLLVCTP